MTLVKTVNKTDNSRLCDTCWKLKKEWMYGDTRQKERKTKKEKKESKITDEQSEAGAEVHLPEGGLCLICSTRPKNTAFIHNNVGHLIGCYQCSKKIWETNKDCPICRRHIRSIVKII